MENALQFWQEFLKLERTDVTRAHRKAYAHPGRLGLSVSLWLAAMPLCTIGLFGCAGSTGGGGFKSVEFEAPSTPDLELASVLRGTHSIGVISGTNIEPVRGLDIEKVMGRLTDATARSLERNAPETTVVTQDEIRWHFKEVFFDSAWVSDTGNRRALRDEMEVDALVYVSLKSFEAQMTPVSPGPYGGMVPTPGMNVSVDLGLSVINLETGESWTQQQERGTSWRPVQAQLLGGGDDGGERQLLTALARPLKQFLVRLAPPPSRERRHFDLSGE